MNFPVIRVRGSSIRFLYCLAAVLTVLLVACSTSNQTTPAATNATSVTTSSSQGGEFGLAALPGYQVSVFTTGTSNIANPDAVELDNGHVFIDYQNTTAKDCSDASKFSSTIVEYTMDGKPVKSFSVPGHSDGMRADPTTHLLWVTSCEDGSPRFNTIDPATGTVTPYTVPATAWGGGLDDMFFVNGMTFVAASNPTLDKNGVNVFPAVYKMTLSNGKVNFTPILMGNASATDLIANSKVNINAVDPDSMTVDDKGNLILMDQAGNEIIYISNPGTAQQKVSRVTVGDQLDDTVWATSTQGRLLVVDANTNRTYWITTSHFTRGTIYTEAPNDSGTIDFVGVVDPTTGFVQPIVIGFGKATGMLFVPNS